MKIALLVTEQDDSKMNWQVTILTQYEDEGSEGMVAVEAISDIRKAYPNEEIALVVFEDGEMHSTRVPPVDVSVVPIQ